MNAGTEAAMSATIALAIAETNQAYADSGINTELRLVHEYRDETYVESSASAFSRALNDITGTTDGVMDDVHTKREFWGADIVALIIDDSQYCGIAWVGPRKQNMFSVTDWGCATGYYSFGHEIGHNQVRTRKLGLCTVCLLMPVSLLRSLATTTLMSLTLTFTIESLCLCIDVLFVNTGLFARSRNIESVRKQPSK